MTTTVAVTSDLDRISGGLARAAAAAPALIATGTLQASETLIAAVVPVIVAHTPHATGKLAASTTADVVMSTDAALITFRQPATSEPNQDGSGGGLPYVQWLVHGRGAIVAPSNGPFSTGKMALRTPWGLRKSVKAAPPNPYPTEAMVEASATVIPLALKSSARAIGRELIRVFGGR